MQKYTTTEFVKGDAPLFYSKQITEDFGVTVSVPIDGYTMNENVSCSDCKYYKEKQHHNEGGYSPTEEICSHKENATYIYDYKGKHEHKIWEPQARNVRLDCELWEKKIPFIQKVKIRLGFE